ncbi:60S ribosomal protein L37a, partial [Neurospora tetraspora]
EVGISGKYGTRYSSSLRKQCKRVEIGQHARYPCTFCDRNTAKRVAFGIWKCHGQGCVKVLSGGAYLLATPAAVTARSTLRRLRDIASVQTGRA